MTGQVFFYNLKGQDQQSIEEFLTTDSKGLVQHANMTLKGKCVNVVTRVKGSDNMTQLNLFPHNNHLRHSPTDLLCIAIFTQERRIVTEQLRTKYKYNQKNKSVEIFSQKQRQRDPLIDKMGKTFM